jgi:hypothetical protein
MPWRVLRGSAVCFSGSRLATLAKLVAPGCWLLVALTLAATQNDKCEAGDAPSPLHQELI